MRYKAGIIGAMESEISLLRARMEEIKPRQFGDLTFYSGYLAGKPMVLVRSGPGKVNAARCAQLLIDVYHPDYLINTGIAGGVGEGLAVGDIVVATGLVQHDFDVTAFGYARGNICARDSAAEPTVFRPDGALVRQLTQAARAVGNVRQGIVATGDVFVSSTAQKKDLAATFHALAAEMEGGAIAQVAQANGVPFAVLRVLSDLADGSAPESFDAFEQQTADLSASILADLLCLL